jgi:hypothetical protein
MGQFAWSSAAEGDCRECGTPPRHSSSSAAARQREHHRYPAGGSNRGVGGGDDCEAADTCRKMVIGDRVTRGVALEKRGSIDDTC